jgi:hypothetical protein
MASDEFGLCPKSTIVLPFIVEGDLTLEFLQQKVLEEMVHARNPEPNGKSKYPELQEYFVPWLGYMFRKAEANFDVNEHVTLWKGDQDCASHMDLYNIRRNLLQAPYLSGRSPWEIILVRNYKPDNLAQKRSVLIGKFHHGVVDGYSLVELFLTSIKEKTEGAKEGIKPKFIRRSALQSICFFLKAVVLSPYTLLEQAPNFQPENIFDPTRVKSSGKRHPVSADIPVSSVKSIYQKTQTCFTSVLLAGLAGGIRSYLIRNKKGVPISVDVSIPLPWPKHPSKIRNYL